MAPDHWDVLVFRDFATTAIVAINPRRIIPNVLAASKLQGPGRASPVECKVIMLDIA